MFNWDFHSLLQKESLSDVQMHCAAMQGDVDILRKILDSGKVHVDSRDKVNDFKLELLRTY